MKTRQPLNSEAVVRWILASIFIVAGLLKVSTLGVKEAPAPDALLAIAQRWPVDVLLVCLEFSTAVFLLARRTVLGLWMSLSLSSLFLLFIAYLLFMDVHPSACGCFGPRVLPPAAHVALLIGMLLLSASGLTTELHTSSRKGSEEVAGVREHRA